MEHKQEELKVLTDPIAEKIDELSDLGEVWNKHRSLKRMPSSVRMAIIDSALELVTLAHAQGVECFESKVDFRP